MTRWQGLVLVTGTDTGVGKTIVAAALTAAAVDRGQRVAVVKPAQTGADDDAGTVARLANPATVTTLAHYPDPLAPFVAARAAGLPPLATRPVLDAVAGLAAHHDLVIVEGAGGLLVPMGLDPTETRPWTVADLAVALNALTIVVVRAGLGTLSHTALTVEALRRRDIPACLVIGSWPGEPQLVHRTNLTDLATVAPLVGRIPEGAGSLPPGEFRRAAVGWFDGSPD